MANNEQYDDQDALGDEAQGDEAQDDGTQTLAQAAPEAVDAHRDLLSRLWGC